MLYLIGGPAQRPLDCFHSQVLFTLLTELVRWLWLSSTHLSMIGNVMQLTCNSPRGQGGGSLQGDEALLQAICGCNTSAKGRAKLYIFTEKSESKSKTQG